MEEKKQGYVYVVYIGENCFKVGKTIDLESRMKQLEKQYGRADLVHLIQSNRHSKFESYLQKLFSSKAVKGKNEVFSLTEIDIKRLKSVSKVNYPVQNEIKKELDYSNYPTSEDNRRHREEDRLEDVERVTKYHEKELREILPHLPDKDIEIIMGKITYYIEKVSYGY